MKQNLQNQADDTGERRVESMAPEGLLFPLISESVHHPRLGRSLALPAYLVPAGGRGSCRAENMCREKNDDKRQNAHLHIIRDALLGLPLGRMLLFYFLWIVLAGAGTPELWVGIPAAVLSGWLSAKLLPAHGLRWRPAGLLWLGARFVRDSVVAGVEIALLILRPEVKIKPGFVSHRILIPGEAMCAFYKSYNSLTPGTLAVEPEPDGSLVFHCLDIRHPVAESLSMNETALLCAFKPGGDAHG